MPLVLIYLLKITISMAVVYLFYQLALRKLTFYKWNRYYLLGYTALCFLIPFINISTVLQQQHWNSSEVITWVPVIGQDVIANGIVETDPVTTFNPWYLVSILLLSGMGLMLVRLLIQWISFRRMLGKAQLLEDGKMKIYKVEGHIIPFSFGNAIFINPSLHTTHELQEIIRHEFVHVKQKHSLDLIWGELICLLNWYNPFAWLLRNAIRQNLEFIADQEVLDHGVDRKQYQYLLLKVIGNDQFSIASKFNFSSLKKRIAMMNKMRSAGLHLLKFLFVLPLCAVLLLAFRNQEQETLADNVLPVLEEKIKFSSFTDSVPPVTTLNSKGYFIDIKGVDGHCVVVVKDRERKEVERVLLTKWKETEKYSEQYGEILPPPHAKGENLIAPVAPVNPKEPVDARPPVPPFAITATSCDPTTITSVTPVGQGTAANPAISRVAKEFEITSTKATLYLKDGTKEEYDLTNAEQKKKFETKYGRIYQTGAGAPVSFISGSQGVTSITTPAPSTAASGKNVINPNGNIITGGEDIIIVITPATTKEELNAFIQQMKAKGVELKFDNMDFNDGKLVSLSGSMKKKNSHSNFTVTDFVKLTLAMKDDDGKIWLKVSTRDEKVVI